MTKKPKTAFLFPPPPAAWLLTINADVHVSSRNEFGFTAENFFDTVTNKKNADDDGTATGWRYCRRCWWTDSVKWLVSAIAGRLLLGIVGVHGSSSNGSGENTCEETRTAFYVAGLRSGETVRGVRETKGTVQNVRPTVETPRDDGAPIVWFIFFFFSSHTDSNVAE